MGEQSVTWRSELLVIAMRKEIEEACMIFVWRYKELEAELLAREADLKTAAIRINGMENLLANAESGWQQESALLREAIAQNQRLRQEIMRITQQELPFDE